MSTRACGRALAAWGRWAELQGVYESVCCALSWA